jgi:hypothetical protein
MDVLTLIWSIRDCGTAPQLCDGMTMRRVIVIGVAGLGLAGCSSFSLDAFKSTPPPLQVQLDSTPQGADARTSLGPGCKTPCSVSVTAPESGGFTVTYALNKFQPATVQVNILRTPGDLIAAGTATADPNPVVAELQPIGPPPKPMRHRPMKPKTPKPPKTAAAPADTTFPDPAATPSR